MQSQKQGVHPLISMWNTDCPRQAHMTTALFFNLQQDGEIFNYYLEPHNPDSTNPTVDVTLSRVCVTGLKSDALSQENSQHLFFSIEAAASVTGVETVDACVSNVDTCQQHLLLHSEYMGSDPDGKASAQANHLYMSELIPTEGPDSGMGSLCGSAEES